MEVVVEFLEGDPDRPLVTGCVFNGDNKYPYKLPDNKTQSGVKSDSSKGHGGYNEFMLEDKKDSELIRMHAQEGSPSPHKCELYSCYAGAVELNSPYQGGDQTWTVGHTRTWTIQKGDDNLEVQMGNLSIDVKMGDISVKADLGKIEIASPCTVDYAQSRQQSGGSRYDGRPHPGPDGRHSGQRDDHGIPPR